MIETNWRFDSVEQAIEFLKSRDVYGSKPGLERMELLFEILAASKDPVYTIHIAGTNGKGSLGAYLESIFHQNKKRAFHYSSPAVFDLRDTWKQFGSQISDEYFIECASRVYEATRLLDERNMSPTRFEVETAMAIYGSTMCANDYLILETGMGGGKDATNVVPWTKICAFTNISYDHMQFLGNSLQEIAMEKAGIIKPGCLVFSAEQKAEVKDVLDAVVEEGTVTYVDSSALELISQKPGELKFKYKGMEYETSLSGLYQMKNAALAIEIARGMNFSEETIVSGIKNARWDGRYQVLSKEPYFIIDGAHNVDAIYQLAETVKLGFTNEPINFIIGVLKDKEHEKMMEMIVPLANRIFTITPPSPRGMGGVELAEEIKKYHRDVTYCSTIEEAVERAMEEGKTSGSATLALGSLSYLGEVKICHDNYLKKQEIL